MDVTAQTFPYHLPRILDELASSCFVTVDFEFSGISKNPAPPTRGAQSLQERYDEVRRAAEKYQILQIGLTICHEDTATATYTLKPYNLLLNPVISEQRLEVEREWVFQSSAIDFLLRNNFQMEALYKEGVPYLSREEASLAMARAAERGDRLKTRTSLDVKETEYDSLEFLRIVRGLVDEWLAVDGDPESYLNIPPPALASASQSSNSLPSVLNSFQKRLVHQLIEVEYPFLVTIGKPSFVQIIAFNQDRENEIKKDRMRLMRQRVLKNTGFRWVAEAMAGGDLSPLDPSLFLDVMSSSTSVDSNCPLKEFATKLKQKLKDHRPVLVGHNLFTDMIYFYACFFGSLPESVEEFQTKVNELFPMLMDTKYMATYDCGSINPKSSLPEINDDLARFMTPKIKIHPSHSKYDTQKIAYEHEAGYDSLLTAQVFAKLSVQLRDGGVSKQPGQSSSVLAHEPQLGHPPQVNGNPPAVPKGTVQREEKTKPHGYRSGYDILEVQEPEETTEDTPENTKVSLRSEDSEDIASKVRAGELIPRLDAEFWKVYGNKLRVFGTVERVCTIIGNKAPQTSQQLAVANVLAT